MLTPPYMHGRQLWSSLIVPLEVGISKNSRHGLVTGCSGGVRCCGSSFVPGMLVVVVTLFASSCPGLIANSSNCHMQFLNTLDCVGLKRRQSTYFLLDSPN